MSKERVTINGEEYEITATEARELFCCYSDGSTHMIRCRKIDKPKKSDDLWQEYETAMWNNTDEKKPKFSYVSDVLARNKIFADYILARVKEEAGK